MPLARGRAAHGGGRQSHTPMRTCTCNPDAPSAFVRCHPSQAQALALPPGLAPSLMKDIQVGDDPNISSSYTSYVSTSAPVTTGSVAWFVAFNKSTGTELWRTDGTPEGTRLVRDLVPGPDSSTLKELAAVDDTVYFLVQENGGTTLWKSDGSAEGTVPVTTSQGPVRNINDLVACNGELFFHGLNSQGSQLWKTNGTAEGTVLLSSSVRFDVYNPPARPSQLLCANGTLFFVGQLPNSIGELWKTDGTPTGTVKLQSVGPLMPPPLSTLTYFTVAGSRVFLNTHNEFQPLWVSDGTPESTRNIPNVGRQAGTPGIKQMQPLGDKLFFNTQDWDYGSKLWTSDGTAEGTQVLLDVSYIFIPVAILPMGDTVLFSDQYNQRLWKSDGTAVGTVFLKNLAPMTSDGEGSGLVLPDGRMLFAASDTRPYGSRWQLWVSDGTEAGTTLFRTAQGQTLSKPSGFRRLGDRVLFWAADGVHGREPWVTDGTPEGTRMVRDIHGIDDSAPRDFTDVEGTLFFTASDSTRQVRGLWRSDGTPEGTFRLKDLSPNPYNDPVKLTATGNTLYFFYSDSSGVSLWKSDGTLEGTVPVRNLGRGRDSNVTAAVMGSTLFFSVYTFQYGYELWKSDGTAEGTVLVKDLLLGKDWNGFGRSSGPRNFTAIGDVLYFTASGDYGTSLWKTDGTPEGTVPVKYIENSWGYHGSNPRDFMVAGGGFFFAVDSGRDGREVWKSDGTPEGTVRLKAFTDRGNNSAISDLAVLGDELFLTADDGTHGRELWKSDGTAEGTVLVKDLVPGPGSAFPPIYSPPSPPRSSLVYSAGGSLYFSVNDGVHGTEPWKSDGTAEGTVLLRDMVPGPLSSGVGTSAFVPVGPQGAVAFAASNGVKGLELWMTDGTSEGTRMVADMAEGAMSSSPTQLTVSGPRLFFVADDDVHGRELWSVKQAAFINR
jgi:ELWxxDGT repeat protein